MKLQILLANCWPYIDLMTFSKKKLKIIETYINIWIWTYVLDHHLPYFYYHFYFLQNWERYNFKFTLNITFLPFGLWELRNTLVCSGQFSKCYEDELYSFLVQTRKALINFGFGFKHTPLEQYCMHISNVFVLNTRIYFPYVSTKSMKENFYNLNSLPKNILYYLYLQ